MEYTPNLSSLKQDQEELHRLTTAAREQERGMVRDQNVWGRGGMEFSPGYGPVRQAFSGEYTIAPEASPNGVTFSTTTGAPVPGGIPRPFDMVEINGQKVEVHVAQRMGLLTSDFRFPGADAEQAFVTRQAPTTRVQAAAPVTHEAETTTAGETSTTAEAVQAAETFQAVTLRQVSPQAVQGLMDDLLTGALSEKTTDLFQLEGATSLPEMGRIVDGYAAKVSQATGASLDQINGWFESNPEAAGKAAQELLSTGRMDGFKALASSGPAASEAFSTAFTEMAPDEAATVYQTAQEPFLRALIEAGIEPDFRPDGIYIAVPGKGVMRWEDAVRNGYAKVSKR